MKSIRTLLLTSLCTGLFLSPQSLLADHHESHNNTLTSEEKANGWVLLFDGKTLDGWRNYRGDDKIAAGWTVEEGNLKKVRGVKAGNIITKKKYRDFEFSWEWNVEKKGNNGIKYLVIEERGGAPGHEYQLLDDDGHPDGKVGGKRQTASLYDIFPPAADKPLKEPGQWNHSKIVIKGMDVQHWLNGKLVLEYTLESPEIRAGIAKSKFKNSKGFGDKVDGFIMITDHHDQCLFRNMKIREL